MIHDPLIKENKTHPYYHHEFYFFRHHHQMLYFMPEALRIKSYSEIFLDIMGGVHREYSIHLGEDGIYVEGGGEVIYIDKTTGQGKYCY